MWAKIKSGDKKRTTKPGTHRKTGTTSKPKTTRKKDNSPLEATEQEMLFRWMEYAKGAHPELALCFAIPNGGSRNVREGHNLRLQGVKAGVPDMCLPVPKGRYGALYIELKRRSGGRVSEEQKAWIAALNRAGNRAVVCKGFDEARDEILRYLGGKSE